MFISYLLWRSGVEIKHMHDNTHTHAFIREVYGDKEVGSFHH